MARRLNKRGSTLAERQAAAEVVGVLSRKHKEPVPEWVTALTNADAPSPPVREEREADAGSMESPRQDAGARSAPWEQTIARNPEPRLTPLELKVVALYSSGDTLEATARKVNVSEATVRAYITRVRQKYADADRPFRTRHDLYALLLEDGWMENVGSS